MNASEGSAAVFKRADNNEDEFTFDEPDDYDQVKEKFEIVGIKMDIHKNGVLYLKELVLNRLMKTQ